MSERRCEGCRWWRYDMQYHGKPHGVCRRQPPVGGEFPEVSGDSMCGEWSDKNITPEQAERRELVRRFALAIASGLKEPKLCYPADIWADARRYAEAENWK